MRIASMRLRASSFEIAFERLLRTVGDRQHRDQQQAGGSAGRRAGWQGWRTRGRSAHEEQHRGASEGPHGDIGRTLFLSPATVLSVSRAAPAAPSTRC
jgi:hypothetical protein